MDTLPEYSLTFLQKSGKALSRLATQGVEALNTQTGNAPRYNTEDA